jgi:prepilin-type N-terminal cleavage/methylation domain-containing protein
MKRRRSNGFTLLEVMTALSITSLVLGTTYLLLSAGIKGRLIVHARISDQERGRRAMAWVADRARQITYDASKAFVVPRCDAGFLSRGTATGRGSAEALAFRAILDETVGRRTYAYYVDNDPTSPTFKSLMEETRGECGDPLLGLIALTPPIVKVNVPSNGCAGPAMGFGFEYYDGGGSQITNITDANASTVRSVSLSMTVQARSILDPSASPPETRRLEEQCYQTIITLRGP